MPGFHKPEVVGPGAVLALAIALCGQTTPTFDAATIRKAAPQEFTSGAERKAAKKAGRIEKPRGGPGSNDPGRIHYPAISLKDLVKSACSAKDYELVGPGWMDSDTFAIDAVMSPSTTKEQFRVMLQNLLAERFQLKTHTENRVIPAYSLVVAKNGSKLLHPGVAPATFKSPDGALVTVAAQVTQTRGPATGSLRWTGMRATMNDLVDRLTEELQRPVADATGLKDKYDFTLTFRQNAAGLTPETADLPDIFSALQSIGLRLESAKTPVEVIVIDHIEKTPAEN